MAFAGVASCGVPEAAWVVGSAWVIVGVVAGRVGPALSRVAECGIPDVTRVESRAGVGSKEGTDGSAKPFT